MIIIPGFLIAILTFPGIIVHEAAHRFFCDLAGVPVYEVCYLRTSNPHGYVIHGRTDRLGANFLISIGPLIVNSILCGIICFTPIIAIRLDAGEMPFVFVALLWLGISIGMHAFPSAQDVANFSQAVHSSGRHGLLYFVAKAFEYVVRLANVLRVIWFDLFYAIGIAHLAPTLIALA